MNLVLNKKYDRGMLRRAFGLLRQQFAFIISATGISTSGHHQQGSVARIRLSIIFPANSIVFTGVQNYVCNALFARKRPRTIGVAIQPCQFYIPGKIK